MTLPTAPISQPAAPAARPARICCECGAEFRPNRSQQQFCCPEHKTAFQNRAAAEGRAIVSLAKAWRASRNAAADKELGSQCLTELAAVLDYFNSEDRAAGRPSAKLHAKALLKQGRFIDRTRR